MSPRTLTKPTPARHLTQSGALQFGAFRQQVRRPTTVTSSTSSFQAQQMLVPTPNANGSSQVESPIVLPITGQSPATNTTDPSNNPRPNPGRRPATNTITPFTDSRTSAADVSSSTVTLRTIPMRPYIPPARTNRTDLEKKRDWATFYITILGLIVGHQRPWISRQWEFPLQKWELPTKHFRDGVFWTERGGPWNLIAKSMATRRLASPHIPHLLPTIQFAVSPQANVDLEDRGILVPESAFVSDSKPDLPPIMPK